MTAVLHDLRENLKLTTEVYGAGSMRTTTAFEQLVRVAADAGTPIDALRHHVDDEVERFFSYTIPGLDGHVYWDGPRLFMQNDGMARTAARWWWHHVHANLPSNKDDLANKCGEKHCINPEHFAKERVRGYQIQWPDTRMIGAIQVVAMRLGHTPTAIEWDANDFSPRSRTIQERFLTWDRAMAAAGLRPSEFVSRTRDKTDVLRGIQLVRRLLGKWPTQAEYPRFAPELRAAGLPTTIAAACRQYGTFVAARVAAGGTSNMHEVRQAGTGEDASATKG